jgi:hypothetical protein
MDVEVGEDNKRKLERVVALVARVIGLQFVKQLQYMQGVETFYGTK